MRWINLKKPFNTLSKSAFAAVIASSALVPVAAQAAEATQPIEGVVVKTADGQFASLSFEKYQEALAVGILSAKDITHVVGNDNKNYTMEKYQEALAITGNLTAAMEKLEEVNAEDKDSKVLEGEIKDGKVVVADETPEEKVNETFFYNLAA